MAHRKSRKKFQKYTELNENEIFNLLKYVGYSQSSAVREICNTKCLHEKRGKSQINNLISYLNKLQEEQNKPKVSRREEIIKSIN